MNPCSQNTHTASYLTPVSSSEEKTSCERKTKEASRASLEQLSFTGTTQRFDSYVRRLREMHLVGSQDLDPIRRLPCGSNFVSAERTSPISSTPVNGDEVAEALQSELAVTTAGDVKPISSLS